MEQNGKNGSEKWKTEGHTQREIERKRESEMKRQRHTFIAEPIKYLQQVCVYIEMLFRRDTQSNQHMTTATPFCYHFGRIAVCRAKTVKRSNQTKLRQLKNLLNILLAAIFQQVCIQNSQQLGSYGSKLVKIGGEQYFFSSFQYI